MISELLIEKRVHFEQLNTQFQNNKNSVLPISEEKNVLFVLPKKSIMRSLFFALPVLHNCTAFCGASSALTNKRLY